MKMWWFCAVIGYSYEIKKNLLVNREYAGNRSLCNIIEVLECGLYEAILV